MKEAYYFSHDCNARHDPKITAMRGVYGSEGYGWYWMLIEMMREAEEYRLSIVGKYAFSAFAMQLQTESKRIEEFVCDCIDEFELFQTDGETFWSSSLLRRMEMRDQTSEARRKAAKARWDKQKKKSDIAKNADDKQNESKPDANAMQGKESKRKESKGKENKEGLEKPATPPTPQYPLLSEEEEERIRVLLIECKLKGASSYTLDEFKSFGGVVEFGLIEAAIKKSSEKHVNYALNTLSSLAAEGKTKLSDFMPSTKVGEKEKDSGGGGGYRGNKPAIPIVQNPTESAKVSDEEFAEYLRIAEERKAASIAQQNLRGGRENAER